MEKKTKKIKNIIKNYLLNNKKEYIIISLAFLFGLFVAVFFVNNMEQNKKEEIQTYFGNSVELIKNSEKINYFEILKTSVVNNLILVVALWFLGTTIIGIPLVFLVVAYKGFSLGYTIAISVFSLGNVKGVIFAIIALLLQNIISIPVLVALGVSGIQVYKSIVKDKRKENIKIEIIRHTIFSLIMLGLLLISSVVETFISTNGILLIGKYL